MRATLLPYSRHSVEEDDIQAVIEVLRSDWLTTGPKISSFEGAFAERVGARYAVAVSSGTAALHAAAFAAGVAHGHHVVVSPMSFVASANCARYQGAMVIFADVAADTLNLDPRCVAANLTEETRAIVTVDYAGQPSDLEELGALAARYKLMLIEDASHALGASYHDRRVGSLADLTTFSLHPVKLITTGEGGMVTTNDAALASRARAFRNHGITTDHRQRSRAASWLYEMVELGFNYRLTDCQSALGLSQLKKLDRWLRRRTEIADRYAAAFAGIPEVEVPTVKSDRRSAWHLYVIRLRLDRLRASREQIFRALRAENIGVNVHYIPIPWHPYYQRLGYAKGQWPVAEDAYERMLSLPMFPGMDDGQVDDVIRAVEKVTAYYRR